MSKKIAQMIGYILFLITLILFFLFIFNKIHSPATQSLEEKNTNQPLIDKNTVYYNGWLKTNGAKLENEKNEIVQLRGLSSHGIEWYSDVITYDNLKQLKDLWKINTFRIAMYTDSYGQGYVSNPDKNTETVCKIADMAIDLDMYVIIDWHILSDNNPQTHKEQAKVFFEKISQKYYNVPNVIYEICNEPNGNDINWNNSIKPYAEEIIPIIRKNSPKSLIIVGTPNWCKDLKQAADNKLNFENIVYSCHFYSGSHGTELQDKIDYCLEKNIPVFVSECGLTDAGGNGDVYFDEFNKWINYLNSNNISWIYWSFSNKNESSAILSPNYKVPVNNDNTTEQSDENTNGNENTDGNENTEDSNNKSSDNNTDKPNITSSGNNNENAENSSNNSSEETVTSIINFDDYLTESGKFIKSVFESYNN